METPKRGLILEYHTFFGEPPPDNRLPLISKTTKLEILALLCHISMKLSPRLSSRVDYTLKTQHDILDHILRLEPDKIRVKQIKEKIKGNAILFNRPSNLWAITDVLNSDIPNDQEDSMISSEDLWNFFKYYLCINTETNKIDNFDLEEGTRAEHINSSIIAHNEYFESVDPLFTLYRGSLLFEHLQSSVEYGELFTEYIHEKTEFSIQRYLLEIASIYFSNHSPDDQFRFFFRLENSLKLFKTFSERDFPVKETHQLEALHIRKSPFYHVKENDYILLDDVFLLEKCYNLLIWDFLFEKLAFGKTGREREQIVKSYRSFIGYFFESYIKEKITLGLPYLKHPAPKLFDDLLIDGIELGDIYIRQNKKIFFGEVKSSNIPSRSKYGLNLSELYGDRDRFFKTHGLDQLVRNLKVLCSHPERFESNLTFRKRHHIYPVIITNELTLTLGMFIQIFNDRFDIEFDRSEFRNLLIKPLMILHVSDLEFLEGYFQDKSLRLFDFLSNHYRKYSIITKLSMSYDHLQPKYSQYQRDKIANIIATGTNV